MEASVRIAIMTMPIITFTTVLVYIGGNQSFLSRDFLFRRFNALRVSF